MSEDFSQERGAPVNGAPPGDARSRQDGGEPEVVEPGVVEPEVVEPEVVEVVEAWASEDDRALSDLAGVAEVARQRDEYLDTLRRVQADFDNYRKRVERQQREMADSAATSLVKKLLPVLDTAELAVAHGGGEDVKQVEGALFEVLAKDGLERIVPEGMDFDPELHDAVAHEPVEGEGAPSVPQVSEVLRAGYRWKGRVLRPAMVKVRG
jgi:molecular chaperone GrpE